MTVLITGANGRIGSGLLADLPGFGWRVRGMDRSTSAVVVQGDVTSPEDLDRAMSGVDAVVHLAGVRLTTPWQVALDVNVTGTVHVFEAARRHGVGRIVYASSNHAVGYTPSADDLPPDLPPRPDTFYGVAKVFGEALGRFYADRYAMRVACLRIGTYAPRPQHRRALETWLSPADCARLVDACLRSDSLSYALVWGVSANTRNRWSLDAGRAIGYHPQDDAETYADELKDAAICDVDDDDVGSRVGGQFTRAEFGTDEIEARWADSATSVARRSPEVGSGSSAASPG